ncbi:uncharacterized protein LOC107647794 [Arachis ipaensis]|uniref:uncharacterized protein LOC107647794 n=1 Tax=Arachis ipaensis TaxID=130454 RepID=UPI000A2B3DDD|nr:uncharacterized protein LOC107647794 [Arachis ipaensis]
MKGLWCSLLVLHLVFQTCCCASDQGGACRPSSCGKITNIKHPFRLKDDPAHCGDQRYELSCESNRTLLYLFPGKCYHVKGINYNNFTIRLVDPAISDSGDDCSTLPRYSLSSSNFSDEGIQYEIIRERRYVVDGSLQYERILENVIFLKCSNPMREDPRYVDAAPCTKEGGNNVYAVLGDLAVGELRDDCRVMMVATSSFLIPPRFFPDDASFFIDQNLSYAEIHRRISYGFDLSWMRGGACPSICGKLLSCHFNETAQNHISCLRDDYCVTPITFTECSKKSTI